ncbi:MAG: hypothetical protein EZS28_026568, partial [Streblomastix strix]
MQRSVNRSKSSNPKASAKRVGRPSNQPKAQNAKEYMQKKQKYIHKSKYIDPRSVAKVPQILHDIGQLQTVQEEADAAIQGFKGKVRQQRIYGRYNPQDLIEMDADTDLNINARFNEPSHDVSSKLEPSAPDQSVYDSDNERMELFGGYNRWYEKPLFDLNPFESNTDQFTDFASQADDYWTDYIIKEQELAQRIMEEEQEAYLQYQITIKQNEEIKDRINQFSGQDIKEIDNDAGTILYFLPENMEQFVATVYKARQGFDRERKIELKEENDQRSELHYNNVIQSVRDIEEFVDKVYEEQHHKAFKIQFNFGVIYEEYKDTRIQEHSPKIIQNQDDIEEYQQYINAEVINMQNYTLDSTRQRYIAIYSMMIKTFNLQPQIVGASMKELIDFHCNCCKNVIYKNTGNNNNCYMEAVAKALHPDSKEKRYRTNEIISISREYLVQVLELRFDSKSRKMTDLLKTFDGLDITKYAKIVSQKLKINQDIYYYDNEHKNYYRGLQVMYQCDEGQSEVNIKTIDILDVESIYERKKISHAFAIANKQALMGLKFCPHCNSKAFDPKDKNYSRDYEKHTIKCENNEGKIVKKVKLEYIQKPFVPHIMLNKTYQYLLANGRQHEFKPTQYFITYDLETVPNIVNKKFGKSSNQMYELFPLSVASTIRNKQEAEQVNVDNQYITEACTIDQTIPYSMEVPI